MPQSAVRELRLALTVDDYNQAVAFYRDGLGLPVDRPLVVGASLAAIWVALLLNLVGVGVGKWLEVSSCSNYTDFQARRMNLRFKPAADAPTQLVHTLNGSALGMSRTYAALIETHLQGDGSIRIPPALQPHFGSDAIR